MIKRLSSLSKVGLRRSLRQNTLHVERSALWPVITRVVAPSGIKPQTASAGPSAVVVCLCERGDALCER
jgi:hypothetical protein